MRRARAWIPLLATLVLLPVAQAPIGAQESGVPFVTVNAAPDGADLAAGEHLQGVEMTNTRPLSAGAVGPLPVFVSDDGYGCVWATAAAAGVEEWIGVGRRGTSSPDTPEATDRCPGFQTKVTSATAAGASALIVVNYEPGATAGTAAGSIPSLMIGGPEGERLIGALDPAAPDAVQVTLELLDPSDFLPPEPVSPTQITSANASASGGTVSVSGRVLFGGQAPVVVGTDPVGDPVNRLPAETGNDIVAGYAGQTDPFTEDVELTWELSQLPPTGGVPEFMSYYWDFGLAVDGSTTLFEVFGRFSNVVGSTVGDPENPNTQRPAFQLEGNCTQDGNIISCEKIADIPATMDPNTGRVTVQIPKSLLEDQVGSSVDGATLQQADIFDGIAVLPSVLVTASGTGDNLLPNEFDYYEIAGAAVEVGIVPAGAPAEYTATVEPSGTGSFSATLDASGLAPGAYDVHVRACFGTNCDTTTTSVTI